MAQPILSIQQDQPKSRAVANLLPCRIHHNGPIDSIAPYWNPTKAEDGTNTAYFRGRKLHGTTVPLPQHCRGVVVQRKENEPRREQPEGEERKETLDEAAAVDVRTMQVTADFDEVVVWGHEAVADAAGDPYVRSIEEWLQVADKIHSYPNGDGTGK